MTSLYYLLESKQYRVKEQASGSLLNSDTLANSVYRCKVVKILQLRAIKTTALAPYSLEFHSQTWRTNS